MSVLDFVTERAKPIAEAVGFTTDTTLYANSSLHEVGGTTMRVDWKAPPTGEQIAALDALLDGYDEWELARAKAAKIAALKEESRVPVLATYDQLDLLSALFKLIDAIANQDAAAIAALAPLTTQLKLVHDKFDDARTAVEAAKTAEEIDVVELDKTGIDIPEIKLVTVRKGK